MQVFEDQAREGWLNGTVHVVAVHPRDDKALEVPQHCRVHLRLASEFLDTTRVAGPLDEDAAVALDDLAELGGDEGGRCEARVLEAGWGAVELDNGDARDVVLRLGLLGGGGVREGVEQEDGPGCLWPAREEVASHEVEGCLGVEDEGQGGHGGVLIGRRRSIPLNL